MVFADAHPDPVVVSIDLSPSQRTFVSPTCQFESDECEDEWTYEHNTFNLCTSTTSVRGYIRLAKLYPQMYAYTKPRGYFRQLEMPVEFSSDHGTVRPGHIMTTGERL
jgi:hypothetical protein